MLVVEPWELFRESFELHVGVNKNAQYYFFFFFFNQQLDCQLNCSQLALRPQKVIFLYLVCIMIIIQYKFWIYILCTQANDLWAYNMWFHGTGDNPVAESSLVLDVRGVFLICSNYQKAKVQLHCWCFGLASERVKWWLLAHMGWMDYKQAMECWAEDIRTTAIQTEQQATIHAALCFEISNTWPAFLWFTGS